MYTPTTKFVIMALAVLAVALAAPVTTTSKAVPTTPKPMPAQARNGNNGINGGNGQNGAAKPLAVVDGKRVNANSKSSGESPIDDADEVEMALSSMVTEEIVEQASNSTELEKQILGEIFGEGAEVKPVQERTREPATPAPAAESSNLRNVVAQITEQLKKSDASNKLSAALIQLKEQYGPVLAKADFSKFDAQSFVGEFLKASGLDKVQAPSAGLPIAPLIDFKRAQPNAQMPKIPANLNELKDLTAALNTQMAKQFGDFLATLQKQVASSDMLNAEQKAQFDTIRQKLQDGSDLQRDANGAIDFSSLFGSFKSNGVSNFLTSSFNNFLKSGSAGLPGGNTGSGALPSSPAELSSIFGMMTGASNGIDFGSVFTQGSGNTAAKSIGDVLKESLGNAVNQGTAALSSAASQFAGNGNNANGNNGNNGKSTSSNAAAGLNVRPQPFPNAFFL